MIYAISIPLAFMLVVFIGYRLRADGANNEKVKQFERMSEYAKKANDARDGVKRTDSLHNDPNNRDMLDDEKN